MPLLVHSARAGGGPGWQCLCDGQLGDGVVTAMSAALLDPDVPLASVAGATVRMEVIGRQFRISRSSGYPGGSVRGTHPVPGFRGRMIAE